MPGETEAGAAKNHPGRFKKGEKPPGRQFQPGVSGNPGGKRKGEKASENTLREACQRITLENLPRIEALLKRPKLNPLALIRALEFVADRGFGRPQQALEMSGPDGGPIRTIASNMTPKEAAALYAEEIAAEE